MVTDQNTTSIQDSSPHGRATAAAPRPAPDISSDPANAVAAGLARLRAILQEERAAIRALDSEAVLRLAERKQEAVDALQKHSDAGLGQLVAEGLGALVPLLRQNLVLLAHARDCLLGAVEAARGEPLAPLAPAGGPAAVRPGLRISVIG